MYCFQHLTAPEQLLNAGEPV